MSLVAVAEADYFTVPLETGSEPDAELTPEQRDALIIELELKMREAAKAFDFEKAARFRDRMRAIQASNIYEEAVASWPDSRR
jgi:excinuclease ABC subunit B